MPWEFESKHVHAHLNAKAKIWPSLSYVPYRGTSLPRKCTPLGNYRRPMPRVLGGSGVVDAGVSADGAGVSFYLAESVCKVVLQKSIPA